MRSFILSIFAADAYAIANVENQDHWASAASSLHSNADECISLVHQGGQRHDQVNDMIKFLFSFHNILLP